jgi:hypothetical protein
VLADQPQDREIHVILDNLRVPGSRLRVSLQIPPSAWSAVSARYSGRSTGQPDA